MAISPRMKVMAGAAVGLSLLLLALAIYTFRFPSVTLPTLSGTLHQGRLEVGGRDRSFWFYLPRSVERRPALLLVLHGSTMDGADMRRATVCGFDVIADREGFIVVYPDGYEKHWNDCRVAGDYEARRLGIDDVSFLRALVGGFVEEYGVARERVFATGLSNGGQMAFRLALEAPDLVRGIAVIAASLPTTENQACAPIGRPLPVMVINGTADPMNPFEGGEVALFGLLYSRGMVQSTMETVRYWARLAGYSGEPSSEFLPDRDPSDGTISRRWVWSADNRPDVVLVEVQNGGHTIPLPQTTVPPILGRTSHDFSACEETWQFFKRAERKGPAAVTPVP
ncbi:MAG: PHB depolymerase family esterase [Acidobacteriota bacterium]